MKENFKEGDLIQVKPAFGIKGSVWFVEIVGPNGYTLLKDGTTDKRKFLQFDNQTNWEKV